ncbi:hypothetical protein KKF34_18145 [Myxococcota bacterium]|nr:hypothetical protein [Myxococcota bacterium]MBU1379716.1 hypothetical protein [Myxococcota bacterium]MBU1498807.1 hypothetical protein [Myxococcota bacterium]
MTQQGTFEAKLDSAFKRNVFSFSQYLDMVRGDPRRRMRNTLEYIRDCMDYFGSTIIVRNSIKIKRFNLFDAPFDDGKDPLIGQEEAQNSFYSFLESQGSKAKSPKIFIMHGPNGSAKSTFFRLIMRAMEVYSRTEDGALYRFNWIFPSGAVLPRGIGFGHGSDHSRMESYAHLDGTAIDALLPDELKDHPLFLLPIEKRGELLEELSGGTRVPEWLLTGDLNPKNRQVFDSLFKSSTSGILEVYKYVQIERYFLSRRYRQGLIISEPKMAADAHIRQLTSDRSIAMLPPALQNLELYKYFGDLIDANRGLIEFADLFKKPVESFKYLINTLEMGYLNMDVAILQFDTCFTATVNDRQLLAFTDTGDFASFEGRSEFVKMPYLLDYNLEKEIHSKFLFSRGDNVTIAPHVLETLAIWSVMTRVVKPQVENEELNGILSELTVYEKAMLYGNGDLPSRYPLKISQQIRSIVAELKYQKLSNIIYEGGIGASPRLVRSILLKAMTNYDVSYVSVLNIFVEIEKVMRDKNTYEFLNYPGQEGGFHDYEAIMDATRGHWENLISADLWDAAGLIQTDRLMESLNNYINVVIHYVKNEKIKNEVTGVYHEASESAMSDFEKELDIEDEPHDFRSNCISRIGAFKIDFPDENPDYSRIFAVELQKMARKSHITRQTQLVRLLESVISVLGEQAKIPQEKMERIDTFKESMLSKGYTVESTLEVLDYYLRNLSGERSSDSHTKS